MKKALPAALSILLLPAFSASAADDSNWPQWRGPDRNGVSQGYDLPLSWSATENVLWKLPIEGKGHSSPVIWGNRIFLTTDIEGEVIPGAQAPQHTRAGEPYRHPQSESADKRHTLKVFAVDAEDGLILWSRTVHDGRVYDDRNIVNTYASPTIATDGERIYAYFGAQGLFAFDFEGNPAWTVDFGDVANWGHGDGTSPLLFENSLIMQVDQDEGDGSFLVALDRSTGKEIWRTTRHERVNYSSPILIRPSDRPQIVTTSYLNVIAYDARTGRETWRNEGKLGTAVPTPVASNDMVYAVSGYPDKLTRALPIPTETSGESVNVEPTWVYRKGSGYTPSPLLYKGYLYLVSDNGVLTCLRPETGEVVYEGGRIPVATFVRASLVAWEDKILVSGEDGDFFVIQAGPEYKILGQGALGERVIASPAIVGNRLYIRSEQHLYGIGKRPGD